jgi:ubiquitin-like protein Nedd8
METSTFRSIIHDDPTTCINPTIVDSLEELIEQFKLIKKQKQQTFLTKNEPFEITAKTLTGRILKCQVRPNDTVLDIKKEIYKQDDLPFEQQRIVFNGKNISDEQTVFDCGIYAGACLHLILRLRGGMFHESSSKIDYLDIKCKTTFYKGLSMIRYIRTKYNMDNIMDNLHRKLIECSKEKELNDIVKLIEQYYLE